MSRRGNSSSAARRGDDAGTPSLAVLLWATLGGAVGWSFQMLAAYAIIAFACTTGHSASNAPRLAILAVSFAALVIVASSAYLARKHWRIARAVDRPTDDHWHARLAERTARIAFLMVCGLFLAAIFALGVTYQALTFGAVPLCEPGIAP